MNKKPYEIAFVCWTRSTQRTRLVLINDIPTKIKRTRRGLDIECTTQTNLQKLTHDKPVYIVSHCVVQMSQTPTHELIIEYIMEFNHRPLKFAAEKRGTTSLIT